MTDNSIMKFDMAEATQRLQERMRGAIAELIPDDVLKGLVEREIKLWVAGEPDKRDGYSGAITHGRPPGIQAIVRKELDAMIGEQVRELLKSPEWSPFWDGQRQAIGPAIGKIIVDNAGEIMERYLKIAIGSQLVGMNVR